MTAIRIFFLTMLLAATVLLRDAVGAIAAGVVWALCVVVLVRSHPNRMLSLAAMYLVLLGLFHLGLVLPVTLHLVAVEHPKWLASRQLGTSLWLFTIAVAAFTLGARLRAPTVELEPHTTAGAQIELFWAGLAVAIAGAALTWIGIYQLGIMGSTYFETYERAVTEDFRFYLFGRMLFPIGLLVASAGATRRQMAALAVLFIIVLGPLFLRGVRGPVILHAASFLAVWGAKDRPVARRVGIVVAAIAVALVPVIRVARDVDTRVVPTVGKVDPIAVVLEAGGSMYPLVVTAERVESGAEPLWMGRSYVQGAAHMLLNVSSRRATFETRDLYPNAWATLQEDPWLFEQGGGIGFSGVAEPYLNFGAPGVVVFFLLLGLFMGSCERWLAHDPFRAGIGAAAFGFIAWTVRDDSVQVPRAVMLACLTVLAAWVATRLRRERQGARAELGLESDVDRSGA